MAWNKDGKYYTSTSKDLARARKQIKNLSLTDEKAWDRSLWNLVGSQSISGETVTEQTALTYSAVWNAVTLISGTIGSLPLHLMHRKGKNNEHATGERVYDVMHTKYNPYMTAKVGRECLMAHVLTWGNGYAEIIRNKMGEITELWPITPDRVTPKIEDSKLVYEIRMDGEANITLSRERVLHVPGLGFDGFIGYSVIAMARKSIGLGMAMETFGSRFFGSGTHPDIIFSTPGPLSTTARDNLRDSVIEYNSGLSKSHRMMFLEEGLSPVKLGHSPEDSQFLGSRQFMITDVARWYNLQVHKLKELTKSSFNNIEAENASFVIDTMLPWFVCFEQNYGMQLLTPTQRKQGYYWKHIVEGLLRANSKDRAQYYKTMIQNTLMTPNEVRAKEDMNPSNDPLADELFIQTGLIPLSKLDEYLAKNTGKQIEQPKEPVTEETKDKLRLLN